jgi:hypothetical protein
MGYFYFEEEYNLTANESKEIPFPGAASLQVLDMTGAVQMQVDNAERSPIRKSTGFDERPFERVRLTETAGATATVTLAVSSGKIRDSRFSAAGSLITNSGDTLSTPGTVTADTDGAELVAASSTRNEVCIQNLHATDYLWIGDANVGNDAAPRGLRLAPGEKVFISTGAAVYGRRGGANDITVGIMELKD